MPQIHGKPNLFRNSEGIIINRDITALARKKASRARRVAESQEIKSLREDMKKMQEIIKTIQTKDTGK